MVHPSTYEELGTDWSLDRETISKANGFLYQIQSPSFLISFMILTLSSAAYPQCMKQDLASEFKKVFAETHKLGKQLHGDHFELSRPRIVGHQSNHESSSPEFLSHVVSEL